MKLSNMRLPGNGSQLTLSLWIAMVLSVILVAGCGGGSGASTPTPAAAVCVPDDPATAAECGTVLVGFTDADGDFLNYSVDVLSLELETAGGAIVETLPRKTRINFSDYVDLTEFVSAATIPPGVYVAGTLSLDYSNAEVIVEAGGESKPAVVVDADGNPLAQVVQKIVLSDRDRLVVSRGRASLLTVDFDLDASHSVDIGATPAIATAEPFIVAEIDPVDTKDIRVRGRFIEANESEMFYTVAIRPFHDRIGDFGRMKVYVSNATAFEVNDVEYVGVEGLRALNASGQGTLTVAQGTLNVAQREFTANIVLAGSSVPGMDRDAVRGNVIARDGNELLVRGATIIRPELDAYFHDDVIVTIGPNTTVFKAGHPNSGLDISAISVGQRVTIRGDVTASDAARVHFDASNGAVRMHLTHLAGLVNTILPGQTDIELHAIDRRRVQVFDFTGTGSSPAMDADPDNYEVSTGNLFMNPLATGRPVVVYGFPYTFGAAPPDFEGRTVVDYANVRSVLGVGWGSAGTLAPFLSIGTDGLVLDNHNPDIGVRHHIKQGPVLIDLTTLPSGTVIAPRETGRKLFAVKTTDSLQLYSNFDDFVQALLIEMDGASTARSMYARGHYNADTNVFTAYKIGIYLLEP
ncbi:MAG: DUF4382 domain-containing protein [Gammaproteobacteria bacterium]|nr:DUF4382 domain-containing protein [Gammaproteobacteria bacterium]MDH4314512.1 DUF4382 domain-containing protein [Gammaproteobacteria bacterium]MDH5215397.1 DUF4382 domain-containing protein [Gammaproteobacteria bacterium]